MSEQQIIEDEDSSTEPAKPVKRLCSEIQLFDLCDLEQCTYKEGRFCTNEELLTRFEQIAEEDVCKPVYASGKIDEGDSDDESEADDAFAEDEFGEEEDNREAE